MGRTWRTLAAVEALSVEDCDALLRAHRVLLELPDVVTYHPAEGMEAGISYLAPQLEVAMAREILGRLILLRVDALDL